MCNNIQVLKTKGCDTIYNLLFTTVVPHYDCFMHYRNHMQYSSSMIMGRQKQFIHVDDLNKTNILFKDQ